MPKLIKNGTSQAYNWQVLRDSEAIAQVDINNGNYLIPLKDWQASPSHFGKNVGVWLSIDTDPSALNATLKQLNVIAIEFDGFMDGRGFSLARILRDDCDFTGELQAAGGYIQDQLFYLKRCGFDAFITADNANIESMLVSLNDFTNSYQAAYDEPRPLFRRR